MNPTLKLLLAFTTLALATPHAALGAADTPAPRPAGSKNAALTPAEAIELLKKRGIVDTSNPALQEKSAELLAHFAAAEQGKESMDAYPYIDTILTLYKEAVARDWTKLPARVVRAFAEQGCHIRDFTACCRCAAAGSVPDQALMLSLLELGSELPAAALNTADADGLTPLMYAVRHGAQPAIIRRMLASGALVNAAAKHGWTPLIFATGLSADAPHAQEIIDLLLEAGAEVNVAISSGWTPLMFAAHTGNPAVVKTLLGKGANIAARNDLGETALLIAATANHTEAARALLDAGANANAKDYDGANALIRITRSTESSQESAALPLVSLLIEKGANVDAANFNGWNPLMFTARNGTPALAQALLSAGAQVDAKDMQGMTPLIFAAGNCRYEVCRLLLQAGANVNQTDSSGLTPLMFATAAKQMKICELFISAGADIHAKAANGLTAADIAATPELKTLFDQAKKTPKN